MVKTVLSQAEYSDMWRWYPNKYKIKVGNDVAYLYDSNDELITCREYKCGFDKLDMSEFWIRCIHELTNLEITKVRKLFMKRYKTKESLHDIYSVPVSNKFYDRWFRVIKLRKEVNFILTLTPNNYPPGYYYAEFERKGVLKDIKLINDNPIELLNDLFFCIECYIGKEVIPHTLSQSWYTDYNRLSDRRYRSTMARYNVQQAHDEYMRLKLEEVFNKTTKATHKEIFELLAQLQSENPYYIFDTIINDPHFSLEDNSFVIYTPIIESGLVIKK